MIQTGIRTRSTRQPSTSIAASASTMREAGFSWTACPRCPCTAATTPRVRPTERARDSRERAQRTRRDDVDRHPGDDERRRDQREPEDAERAEVDVGRVGQGHSPTVVPRSAVVAAVQSAHAGGSPRGTGGGGGGVDERSGREDRSSCAPAPLAGRGRRTVLGCAAVCPGCSRRWTVGYSARMMAASPWPPPPHSAAAPRPPPRRRSSLMSVIAMRVPDMPIG